MADKKSRSPNSGKKPSKGAPPEEQDVKRRLGDFTGKGEHARQGGREGIIGQTKQRFKTDKKRGN